MFKYLLILCTFFSDYAISNDKIYSADIEYIVTKINDYSSVNQELVNLSLKLVNELKPLEDSLSNLKVKAMSLKDLSLKESNWNPEIQELELKILEKKKINSYLLKEKERSLKFPLIKKVLEHIQKKYDQSTVNFIIDQDSIFFYKKENLSAYDLSDDIIRTYNENK